MKEPALDSARGPGATLTSVDGRTYPLESARVSARSEGGIAASRLVQVFANPHDEPLEVTYTMPLPADGAVLGYTIRMGEKVIRGEIESREKAEARYMEALYQGKTAGLLEQDRADTFQQRLGNLPPRTKAEIEIEVLQPLAFLPGAPGAPPQWEYRFPTVVGVRYEGDPGRVPDAARLEVDRDAEGNIPTRVEFEIVIAGWPGGEPRVESPNHDLRVETAGDTAKAVLAHAARLDRDIVVRWGACSQDVGVRLTVGGGLPGDDGCYGLITIVPPAVPRVTFARDVTVLIDASGSMQGAPIAAAKKVVVELLHGLTSEDRFELLEFASDPRRLTNGMVPASRDAVERAVKVVDRIQASGGTEMTKALVEALRPLRPDAQRQVILVSDGDIGFEEEALRAVLEGLPAGARLHCVGIGAAPNRTLTQGLARAGRGVELFAQDETTALDAARRLGAATVRPVLTEVSVSGGAVRKVAPARPRDVLAGQPLVMGVELDPRGGPLEVRGRLAGAAEAWVRHIEVPAGGAVEGSAGVSASPLPIGALYGREAIADVEAELRGRNYEDCLQKIEGLGMRHRITSRRTSLVAIAEEPGVDPTAPRRRERLAVELPSGVSAAGVGLMGRMGAPRAAMPGIGADEMDFMKLSPTGILRTGARSIGGWPRASLAGPEPGIGGRGVTIGRATVIKVEKRILVLEFEVPVEGFQIPEGRVQVFVGGEKLGDASVVAGRSTRREPLAQGLVVKLALEHPHGKKWEEGRRIEIRWEDEIESSDGSVVRAEFDLSVTIEPSEGGGRE
jgi:Ca-activated chloride channel family protein